MLKLWLKCFCGAGTALAVAGIGDVLIANSIIDGGPAWHAIIGLLMNLAVLATILTYIFAGEDL